MVTLIMRLDYFTHHFRVSSILLVGPLQEATNVFDATMNYNLEEFASSIFYIPSVSLSDVGEIGYFLLRKSKKIVGVPNRT